MFIAKIRSPQEKVSLVLASASLGRAYVLKQAAIDFTVDAADIDEHNFTATSVMELVAVLAAAKAEKVKARHQNGLILAVDTLVVLDNQIIGKPKDTTDAIRILTQLSGRTHQVISGIIVCDLDEKRTAQDVVLSDVTFKQLSAQEITAYVATNEPWGKAGAYSSQEKGKALIEKIVGDPTNVIGLPMQSFRKLLLVLGYELV